MTTTPAMSTTTTTTPLKPGTKIEVEFDFTGRTDDELDVKAGMLLEVVEDQGEWVVAFNEQVGEGIVPRDYVKEFNPFDLFEGNGGDEQQQQEQEHEEEGEPPSHPPRREDDVESVFRHDATTNDQSEIDTKLQQQELEDAQITASELTKRFEELKARFMESLDSEPENNLEVSLPPPAPTKPPVFPPDVTSSSPPLPSRKHLPPGAVPTPFAVGGTPLPPPVEPTPKREKSPPPHPDEAEAPPLPPRAPIVSKKPLTVAPAPAKLPPPPSPAEVEAAMRREEEELIRKREEASKARAAVLAEENARSLPAEAPPKMELPPAVKGKPVGVNHLTLAQEYYNRAVVHENNRRTPDARLNYARALYYYLRALPTIDAATKLQVLHVMEQLVESLSEGGAPFEDRVGVLLTMTSHGYASKVRGMEMRTRAVELDRRGKPEEALGVYLLALDYLFAHMKSQKEAGKEVDASSRAALNEMLARAETLKAEKKRFTAV